MTFGEMIEEYGFTSYTSQVFQRRISETSLLVIERRMLSERGEVYDFYKVKTGRIPEIKIYCDAEEEFLLISRVQKFFAFIKEEKAKKRLQPYGGSMVEYQKHLRERKEVEKRRKEKKELSECWKMISNKLELVNNENERRKYDPNQMRMKI